MRSRDGSALRRITTSARANEARPTWSPDGLNIIFDSDADGDLELFVREFDGTSERRLTDNTADDYGAIYAQ
jgi:Tol biopolymer transport system component